LAKSELRKLGFSDEVVAESNSYSETTDEDILKARRKYMEFYNVYKDEIKKAAEEVKACGGLYVIGTERHETRRIDNQLRGRAGRQGDPGKSRFYLSLEDDLMRLFGGDRMQRMMARLNVDEDTPLEAKMLTRSIEAAQKKIEGRNFGIRKHVLQYDDVLNRQREIIYGQRDKVLDGADLKDQIYKMIDDVAESVVGRFVSNDLPKEHWNIEGLRGYYMDWVFTQSDFTEENNNPIDMTPEDIVDFIKKRCHEIYAKHEEVIGTEGARELERVVLLGSVDEQWMDHIDAMEELKRGINLRAYGQRDPIVEYRVEGFEMFDAMVDAIKENTVKVLLSFKINMERMRSSIVSFPGGDK